jgi:tripartite-type tricarboxylate transporter receptor subunit TctC
MKLSKVLLILAALIAWVQSAAAQDWPARPVKIIVPFAAGSTPDIVARLVAEALQREYRGQAFVVENKPGANGNLGTEAVATASPDGYTIGVSIGGPLAINTLLFPNLRYNPATDIAPITQLVSQPSVLAVHASLGITSVQDLIAAVKREPGRLNYGSIGAGSLSHLSMEAIAALAQAPITHIPFRGSPLAVTALLRNDVQMGVLPAASIAVHAASGQVRLLAVSTASRSPFLPDLPTLKEAGVDVEADAWVALIAPAGTPASIISSLHSAASRAIHLPDIKEKFGAQMMQPVGGTPAQLRDLMSAEISRWRPIIKAANIQVD